MRFQREVSQILHDFVGYDEKFTFNAKEIGKTVFKQRNNRVT